ncbi:hypothetical protein [Lacipirellula parvula]|uniref:Uncharacterized protein n=1 Tax=Lacipirellula parvula TaxID=2650471 RepID=A0A5K7X455_9BACT|nr:hypothetical protein [Lacipirellula parvula]BBO30582.1 hypothetical protein PLANPX_0194 [Lacipirellula parvula]
MSSQPSNFGPWSTALDNGTRMQLSAFWRQRMAGLARLPVGRRLSRRGASCGIIATLLLAATPLVELSSEAVAEEKPPAEQQADPKTDGQFVWRFSNGLEVELIGLAKNPSKDETWWRPDGAPLPDASLPQARYRSDDRGARELAFRWRNIGDNPDQTRLWHTLPPYGGAGGGVSEKEAEGSILEVTGVTFVSGRETATVTFTASVASTPWKKAFDTDGRNASSAGLMVDGKPLSAAFATAYETKTGIAITASYGIGSQAGRLVLFDASGKELLPTRTNGVGSTHFTQTTFEFDGVTPADVERFELQTQTRTMETVMFHNVSLEPGRATKVVIEPCKADSRGVETSYLPMEARVAIAGWGEKRIDRASLLGPITSGEEVVFLDPPSDEEVLKVFQKSPHIKRSTPRSEEDLARKVDRIEKRKLNEKVGPSRVYPMIGAGKKVQSTYLYTIHFQDGTQEEFAVDHHHLHAMLNENEEEKKTKAAPKSASDQSELR